MEKEEIMFDRVVKKTDAAWLVEIDGREVWLPKSQCDIDEEEGVAEIPEWLAIREELV